MMELSEVRIYDYRNFLKLIYNVLRDKAHARIDRQNPR
jgi:hypothetical protein